MFALSSHALFCEPARLYRPGPPLISIFHHTTFYLSGYISFNEKTRKETFHSSSSSQQEQRVDVQSTLGEFRTGWLLVGLAN
jgi:hypothetical protein